MSNDKKSTMHKLIRLLFLCTLIAAFIAGAARAAEPDPKVLSYTLPANIQWVDNAARTNQTALIYGDPAKPGPYYLLLKWKAGNMSRPHFHENDRFFVVVSGTWWVGTGPKFDPASTVPMPAGSLVTHFARGIHYDGAKDGDAIIALYGMGPVSTIPA
jgi:hypothetical protein